MWSRSTHQQGDLPDMGFWISKILGHNAGDFVIYLLQITK